MSSLQRSRANQTPQQDLAPAPAPTLGPPQSNQEAQEALRAAGPGGVATTDGGHAAEGPPAGDPPAGPGGMRGLLARFGPLLGIDLSDVELSSGDAATAQQAGGRDVITLSGNDAEAAAHEAIHVAQRRARPNTARRETSEDGDAAEREARALAPALLAGRPVTVKAAPAAHTQHEDAPSPLDRLWLALVDGRGAEALATLREGGASLRADYNLRFGERLESAFLRSTDAQTSAAALVILWPVMSGAERFEYNLGANDNEAGIAQLIMTTPVEELLTLGAKLNDYIAELGAKQAFDARMYIWPDKAVEHMGLLIQEGDGYVFDDEADVISTLLRLTPAQRLEVWAAYEDGLKDLLSDDQLDQVKRMCVGAGEGGTATEADALQASMSLSVGTFNDDEALAFSTMGRTNELVKEQAALKGQLNAGVGADGKPLTDEARARLTARLTEIGDLSGLLSTSDAEGEHADSSFLGMAQQATEDADVVATTQAGLGGDAFEVAKTRLLQAVGWAGDDEDAILAVLENIHAQVEIPEGTSDADRVRIQAEADAALLQRLKEDETLKEEVWGSIGGKDKDAADALLDGDTAAADAAMLRRYIGFFTTDQPGLLKRLLTLDQARRDAVKADTELVAELKAEGDGDWAKTIQGVLDTGQLPTDAALNYAMGETNDGTDEDVVTMALSGLTEEDRTTLRRGYLLSKRGGDIAEADQAALKKYTELRARLEGELSGGDLDRAIEAMLGTTPAGDTLTDQGRLDALDIMRARQEERVAMEAWGAETFGSTHETLAQARAQFEEGYQAAVADKSVTIEEFAILAAIDAQFNLAFEAHSTAASAISDTIATVAGVVVGVVIVALSGGTASPGVAAALSQLNNARSIAAVLALSGGASAAGGELSGGDFVDSDDAFKNFAQGGAEAIFTLIGARLATAGVRLVGLSDDVLKASMVRAAAGETATGIAGRGSQISAKTLEAVFDGAIGGGLGEMTFTALDAQTWSKGIWSAIVSLGQALLRGMATGGVGGAVMGLPLAVVDALVSARALRGVSAQLDDTLGANAKVVAQVTEGGGTKYSITYGPQITEADLAVHLDALVQMQRLDTLSAKIGSVLNKQADLPAQSVGAQARIELQKLQEMLLERQRTLSGSADLSPQSRIDLEAEVKLMELRSEVQLSKLDDPTPLTEPLTVHGPGFKTREEVLAELGDSMPDDHVLYQIQEGRWGIRRKPGGVDDGVLPKTLEEGNDGRLIVTDRSTRRASAMFDAGTSGEKVLSQLTSPGSTSSLKQFAEMLKKNGLATDNELLAAANDAVAKFVGKEIPEDNVRQMIKQRFRDRVVDAMFGGPQGAPTLTLAEAYAKRSELCKGLNSGDVGWFGEEWTRRALIEFEGVDPNAILRHPTVPDSLLVDDKALDLDLVIGDTIFEVKAGKGALDGRAKESLQDYLRVVNEEDGHVLVNGKEQAVNKLKLRFLEVEGAKSSLGMLGDIFEDGNGHLSVEIFTGSRFEAFSSLDELQAALRQEGQP